MKKLLAVLLALSLVFALCACSGSGSGTDGQGAQEQTEAPVLHIKDDNAVPGMTFTAPEGYTSVERTFDRANGVLTEKNIKFFYDEETSLNFAYGDSQGHDLSDLVSLDGLETVEQDGKSFYISEQGTETMALLQVDNILYGIDFAHSDDNEDRGRLDQALASVKFEDVDVVLENEDEEVLGDITFRLDPSLNVASTYSADRENLEGETIRKSMTWRFGADKDNLDFRFLIRYIKNAKVEDELNAETTYEERTVGDLTYTVRVDSDENKTPCDYFIQHGDDVYMIKNLGVSSGWGTTRSDESKEAFNAFIQTVSFK